MGAAEELGMIERVSHNNNNNNSYKSAIEDGPGKKMTLNKPLEVISCSSLLFIIHLKSLGSSCKVFSTFRLFYFFRYILMGHLELHLVTYFEQNMPC